MNNQRVVLRWVLVLCAIGEIVPSLSAQAATQLPDGTQFQFWEKPFTPSRTYYVSGTTGNDQNSGTMGQPFKTINRAAQVLEPGERVVIASGIYRECIDPVRGGTGPEKLISYEAAPGANVIVSGAMRVESWESSTGFAESGPHEGNPNICQVKPNGAWFGGYNPFGMVNLPQQKAFLVTVGNRLPGQPGYNMPWLREQNNLSLTIGAAAWCLSTASR
jgi:hypothetical protein